MQRMLSIKISVNLILAAIVATAFVVFLSTGAVNAQGATPAATPASPTTAASVDFSSGDCSGLSGSDRTKCEACRGAGSSGYNAGKCTDSSGNAEEQVGNLVTSAINIFSFVVGVVSVIMIIIGGLKYVMSSGDSGNITSAKNTILYAIIGLVIVAFAQVIVLFVINKATPAPTTPTSTTP